MKRGCSTICFKCPHLHLAKALTTVLSLTTQWLLRNATMRLMGLPVVSKLAMGRSLRDPIELPAW